VGTVRSRWRWLALAYPVLTTLAVVVTANHFWLDGIAAAALLAVAIGAQRAAGPAYRGLAGSVRLSGPAPAPVDAAAPVHAAAAADAREMVPAGAITARAAAARGMTAAVGPGGVPEPGQSPGGAQAAPSAHMRAHNGSRPCAARAVGARATSRNRAGRRPQAGHESPARDQDGR